MADNKQEIKKTVTVKEYFDKMDTLVMGDLKSWTSKGLQLPADYAPRNAFQNAVTAIRTTVDRDKHPALTVCTADSIRNAILETLTKGLDPGETQCYYIVYGKELTMFESYMGWIARAKRADPNIVDIYAEVVYKKDTFKYSIKRGVKVVVEHLQEADNVILGEIKGAYATILYKDDREVSEYMSMEQITNSWARGQTKGKSTAHTGAPEEMCKRTVLKRLLKLTINTQSNKKLLGDIADEIETIENEQAAAEATIDITPPDESEAQKYINDRNDEPEPAPEPAKPAPTKTTAQKKEAKPEQEPVQESFLDDMPDCLKDQ